MVLAAAITAVLPAQLMAQKVAKGGIHIKELKAKKENRQVSVEMIFDLDSLQLPSNRFLTLTPVISDGTDTLFLRPVIVSGRRQHIMYERERRKYPEYADAEELRFRPGKKQTVPYRVMVPYENGCTGPP